MARVKMVALAFFILGFCAGAVRAASVGDFRIRGVYIGMSEKQLQDTMGTLEREKKSEFKELNTNDKLELFIPRKDKDMLVGLDKESRKVVFVMGNELSKEGNVVLLQGDYQFRANLGLMPMQHDANWIYRNDKFNIAIQFTRDAMKTSPTIARIFIAEPSIPVKGGWMGGVDPRPDPRNNNGGYDVQ